MLLIFVADCISPFVFYRSVACLYSHLVCIGKAEAAINLYRYCSSVEAQNHWRIITIASEPTRVQSFCSADLTRDDEPHHHESHSHSTLLHKENINPHWFTPPQTFYGIMTNLCLMPYKCSKLVSWTGGQLLAGGLWLGPFEKEMDRLP